MRLCNSPHLTARRQVALFFVVVALAVGIACGDNDGSTTPEPATTTAVLAGATPTAAPSNTVWLCRPGLADNPCESDMAATVVSADGTSATEQASPAKDPPIDCFYVYPTVSGQTTTNADLTVDPAQTAVAILQASRFSQVCRVYAPMYRQITVTGIRALLSGALPGDEAAASITTAYSDVLSAWQDYLAHYNNGRGVVLISHSQGTLMLRRLLISEIDPKPEIRRLLISALLIGGNVTVAKGKDVGGDFQNIPACRSADQTGCVVAYSTFLEPPPADTLFGRAGRGVRGNLDTGTGMDVLCVNPASITGGTGPLKPYFPSTMSPGLFSGTTARSSSASTPWISYPGLYTGHCESSGDANWLQVDTTNVAGDERPVVSQSLGPTWGLHLVDVTIALGNLVELVGKQAAAFTE